MGRLIEHTLGLITTPPKFGCGLSVVGNVPNIQQFDATNGSYEPNYTRTPLTIQVDVAAIDGDTPLSTTNARTMLSNIHWYELNADGTRTEIVINGNSSTPSGYASLINTEGDPNAGQLQVAKNATPSAPINLQFEADVYTGCDTFHFAENISIQCRDSSPSVRCKFDSPDIVPYNPIHDPNILPIALRVWENGRDADPSHFMPVWEIRRDDGTWSEYGVETTDYWLDIAADKMSAKLDMELMAEGVNIRVRLRYDKGGNPAGVTLSANDLSVPFCRMECTRTLGKYDHKLTNMTNTIAEWSTVVRPTVIFEDNKGEIPNPDNFFRVTIYACPAGRTLTENDVVGIGRTVDIPCAGKDAVGLKVGYSVDEIGPFKAWADSDGSILTDSDGAILLIR